MDILCQSNLSFLRFYAVSIDLPSREKFELYFFFFFFLLILTDHYGSNSSTAILLWIRSFKVDLNRARISNMIYPLELFFFFLTSSVLSRRKR